MRVVPPSLQQLHVEREWLPGNVNVVLLEHYCDPEDYYALAAPAAPPG